MNSRLVANVGTLAIGGDNPVRVQTMYDDSIKDTDPQLVVDRINTLAAMGCDLIRFSYVSSQDGENFRYITSRSPIPVVADIHFELVRDIVVTNDDDSSLWRDQCDLIHCVLIQVPVLDLHDILPA